MSHRYSMPVGYLMSRAEEEVLGALSLLPLGFDVQAGARFAVPSPTGNGLSSIYQPDFEITAPDGRKIEVEVKSGLSIPNLSRFIEIDRAIRNSGKGFLVLVYDRQSSPLLSRSLPEFQNLHIRAVQSPFEIVNSVLEEMSYIGSARH